MEILSPGATPETACHQTVGEQLGLKPKAAKILGTVAGYQEEFDTDRLVRDLFGDAIENENTSYVNAAQIVRRILPDIVLGNNPVGKCEKKVDPNRKNVLVYSFKPYDDTTAQMLSEEVKGVKFSDLRGHNSRMKKIDKDNFNDSRTAIPQELKPRLTFTLSRDSGAYYDGRITVPKRSGQTSQLQFLKPEADLFAAIFESPMRMKQEALEMRMARYSHWNIFQKRGGFEAVLNNLNPKLLSWGITIKENEEHQLDLLPCSTPDDIQTFTSNDRTHEDPAQHTDDEKTRRRGPSHGRARI